jgi:serine protease
MLRLLPVLGLLLVLPAFAVLADERRPPRTPTVTEPTGRFIVKFNAEASADQRRSALATAPAAGRGRQRAALLAGRLGMPLQASREISAELVNLVGPADMTPGQQADWLARLAAEPDVEFAVVDERRRAHALPGDPIFLEQWYLQSTEVSAARNEVAWETTTGATDTVVAVLDTGIRYEHPDLGRVSEGGRMLPGYDFVSGEAAGTFRVANDGDGWDADPSDPGDWLSDADLATSLFRGCVPPGQLPPSSSWHGTRVAGMLAAVTNNGAGMAGGTWNGSVLPVRVLGKCGGYDSDIIAGMRWAAGLAVAGAPANPHPAQILNMSLGGEGPCTPAYENVMTDLNAAGVLVVVSAGNQTGPVNLPANCTGALGVAGLRQVGTKVGYSSLGIQVGIAAPAGNCVNLSGACLFSLVTTTNNGGTTPTTSGYTNAFNFNVGTSFAAPIVAGIAALMHGVNASLQAPDYIARLQAGSRPFPVEAGLPTCPSTDPVTGQCNCTTTTCGAGIADAPAAVEEALRPIARIAEPASTAPGTTVTLNGTGSAAARNRTISSYAWSVTSGPAGTVIANPTQPTASVVAPGTGIATISLTVNDDNGLSDTTSIAVGAAPSGGGGGGGAVDPWVLGLLLTALARSRRQRQRQR